MVRSPCFPASYNPDAPPGNCQWCSHPTEAGARWHPLCKESFQIATDPAFARAKVYERDKGVCAETGEVAAVWQHDHIRPLWDVDRSHPEAWRCWQLENMQTLSGAAHERKTTREAARRSKLKRIQSLDGLRRKKLNRRDRYIARRAAEPQF